MAICKNCNKEIKNPNWNQIYCSNECREEYYDKRNQSRKKQNGCAICGFWRFTESHHIIKQIDFGANNENNLIQLCPNHHKMADSYRYGEEFLNLLKKKTGKVGERLKENEIKKVKDYIISILRKGWKEFNGENLDENSYGFRQEHRNLILSGIFYEVAMNNVDFAQLKEKDLHTTKPNSCAE